MDRNSNITAWLRFTPTSIDPLQFDLQENHICFRSVLGSLVSNYSLGKISPQISNKWENSNDFKEWTFYIDPRWEFSNGEKVTGVDVGRNFLRVIIEKQKKDSRSGLFEFILGGRKHIKSTDDKIEGIDYDKEKVTLRFIKSMPDLLDQLSFGLYAIAHSSNYDKFGSWIDTKQFITSGKYRISKWSDSVLTIELQRKFLSNDGDDVKGVEFIFSNSPDIISGVDIQFREKLNLLVDTEKWQFVSKNLESNNTYIKVMKWSDKNNPLSDVQLRRYLRSLYYKKLEENKFFPSLSFFPLSLKGVRELSKDASFKIEKEFPRFTTITTPPFFKPLKSKNNMNKKDLGEIFQQSFFDFALALNAELKIENYPSNILDEEKIFDFQFLGTGIDIDYPYDDIRFMFLSKHGIKLPDATGNIKKIISSEVFDIQKINQEIWDQAILWPIRFSSVGFWVKKEARLSFEDLNTSKNPIDFQFVRWQ